MTTITIKYFGAYRRLGTDTALAIPDGTTVATLKTLLWQSLGEEHRQLVEDSVLADDTTILSNDTLLAQATTLVILPPVCGG